MITMTMITISRTASKTASRERDVELKIRGFGFRARRRVACSSIRGRRTLRRPARAARARAPKPAADDHPELPERLHEGRVSAEAAERALVRKPQIGDTRPAPAAPAPRRRRPSADRRVVKDPAKALGRRAPGHASSPASCRCCAGMTSAV